MNDHRADDWSRREFVGWGVALAGTAGLLGVRPQVVAAGPPPETRRIRLPLAPAPCTAPQYVAEELLRGAGFAEVQYVKAALGRLAHIATEQADIGITFAGPLVLQIDAGDPIVVLAGVHPGCFELFARDDIRTISDLKGKTVGVIQLGSSQHVFLAAMAAYVGLNPATEITWVTHPREEARKRLIERSIDAYMAFAPEPQAFRASGLRHVVVNSAVDRPWSQYFCCMVSANREFVRKHPIATKQALRAILKSIDVCGTEPERVARSIVAKGVAPSDAYEDVVRAYREIPYAVWRQYEPEDTLRFYALRLHEAGLIKSTPQKIIAQGTDWRFLNELRKELKG
jgi:NitT/TauT family transport system substrate-binding protein